MHLTVGALRIDCHEVDRRFVLSWIGRSTEPKPAKDITPFVSQILRNARDRKASVVMNLEMLEYGNSRTIASLITIIHESIANSVNIRLVFDDRIAWQRSTFQALRIFGHDALVELTTTHPGSPS